MCGIFGVLQHRPTGVPDAARLRESAELLAHRGPDSHGIYSDHGVGLAHTRLSLLDLTPRSDQPFWDRQRRYCLVYNGEIYNFKKLRSELERDGVGFRTTSDTEVLLEAVIKWGLEATLPRLEGMFAFSIYDSETRTMVLARDRFGIKPLFIYDQDEAFLFASEVRALHPWLDLQPDILSILGFLHGLPEPNFRSHTFYKRVKFLPPGGVIKIRAGERARHGQFFSLTDFWDPDEVESLKRLRPTEVADRLEAILLDSVKQQLFADARVGGLCSGGVDSSLILAMAARFHDDLAIFHANVVGKHSEYDAAAALAKHLKLELKAVEVRDEHFVNLFADVIEHYGHPFDRHPHSIPFLMVSRLAREHGVKAVLTGEGADECFLGYSRNAPDVLKWRRNPRRFLTSAYRSLKGLWAKTNAKPSQDIVLQMQNRFVRVLEAENTRTKLRAATGGLRAHDFRTLDELGGVLPSLLHRNDTMGMAAGIESRFPFLDTALVKLAVNAPYRCKIRLSLSLSDPAHYFVENKWALRRVADRYLPSSLSRRRKVPFPVDALARMRIAPDLFYNSHVAELFELTDKEICYLVENSLQHVRVRLLDLEVWAHICLRNLPKADIASRLRSHITMR